MFVPFSYKKLTGQCQPNERSSFSNELSERLITPGMAKVAFVLENSSLDRLYKTKTDNVTTYSCI